MNNDSTAIFYSFICKLYLHHSYSISKLSVVSMLYVEVSIETDFNAFLLSVFFSPNLWIIPNSLFFLFTIFLFLFPPSLSSYLSLPLSYCIEKRRETGLRLIKSQACAIKDKQQIERSLPSLALDRSTRRSVRA